jgi:hypothetical protein
LGRPRSQGGEKRASRAKELGGRLHHRKAKHYGYKETIPPVLYALSAVSLDSLQFRGLHLLKLVTGVEISTRPVSRSGSPGKEVKMRRRTAAAAPKRAAFRLSRLILANYQDSNCLIQGPAIAGSLEFEILVQGQLCPQLSYPRPRIQGGPCKAVNSIGQ